MMENTNWLRQTPEKPLFEDLFWSRPENKRCAGKLLIVGGNLHGFKAPAVAFSLATAAGAGAIRVLLPDSTKKILGKTFAEAEFAPSTPSGSFGRAALEQLIEAGQWAEGVLLAGDFGRNSETAILLDSLASKYAGQMTVAGDGTDYFLAKNSLLLERDNTTSVINLGKLQKLAKFNRPQPAIRHAMSLHKLVKVLSDWTAGQKFGLITKHEDAAVVAWGGQVSTTPMNSEIDWQTELAAYISVWQMQQPKKPFQAITAAVFDYQKK